MQPSLKIFERRNRIERHIHEFARMSILQKDGYTFLANFNDDIYTFLPVLKR